MDETADNRGDERREGAGSQLPAATLELIARLDREIGELRQRAPGDYDQTIASLEETMLAIHDAIDGPKVAKCR